MPVLRLWDLSNDYLLKHNFEIINTYLQEDNYKRFFTVDDFYLDGSTGLSKVNVSTRWPALEFAEIAGSTSTAYLTSYISSLWIDGAIEITFWVVDTGAAGSGGNVVWNILGAVNSDAVNSHQFNVNEIHTGVSSTTLSTTTFTQRYSIDKDDRVLSLRVRRLSNNASDTSTDDVGVVGVLLEYIPNKE